MAEDEPDHEQLITSLEAGDIHPRFYEGGFKTWECALDLARFVLSDVDVVCAQGEDEDEALHVIEV